MVNFFEKELVISKDLSQWCIDNIKILEDEEINKRLIKNNSGKSERENIQRKLSNLLDIRISKDKITPEEEEVFSIKERELKGQLHGLSIKNEIQKGNRLSIEEVIKDFNLMSEIMDIFKNGSPEDKKSSLLELGSNLVITDQNISIYNKKTIQILINGLRKAKDKNGGFEPKYTLANKDKTEVFSSVCPILLPLSDKFRTCNWSNFDTNLGIIMNNFNSVKI